MRLVLQNVVSGHMDATLPSITNSLACGLSIQPMLSIFSLSFSHTHTFVSSTRLGLCSQRQISLQNDRQNRGPVLSIRPIRRLVLLNTILGASRKSLYAHSSMIYRSRSPRPLYSAEYLEYLDKYRGLRGQDGLCLGYSRHCHLLFLAPCYLLCQRGIFYDVWLRIEVDTVVLLNNLSGFIEPKLAQGFGKFLLIFYSQMFFMHLWKNLNLETASKRYDKQC